jgi:hypothetical protein
MYKSNYKETLENIEGAIKNGKSRETGNIGSKIQDMISLPRTTILYYSFRVRITVFNATFNNISVISWHYFIVHHKFFAIKEM